MVLVLVLTYIIYCLYLLPSSWYWYCHISFTAFTNFLLNGTGTCTVIYHLLPLPTSYSMVLVLVLSYIIYCLYLLPTQWYWYLYCHISFTAFTYFLLNGTGTCTVIYHLLPLPTSYSMVLVLVLTYHLLPLSTSYSMVLVLVLSYIIYCLYLLPTQWYWYLYCHISFTAFTYFLLNGTGTCTVIYHLLPLPTSYSMVLVLVLTYHLLPLSTSYSMALVLVLTYHLLPLSTSYSMVLVLVLSYIIYCLYLLPTQWYWYLYCHISFTAFIYFLLNGTGTCTDIFNFHFTWKNN